MKIFFLLFIVTFLIMSVYTYFRFFNKLDIKPLYKNLLKIFLFANFIGAIGYIIFRRNPEISNTLYFLLSLPIGVIFLLFTTAIIYDITHLFVKKIPMDNKRRKFFKTSLDVTSLALASGLTSKAIYEAMDIQTITTHIKIKNLKKPYKIVQLSDVHIGGLIGEKYIKDLVQKVNILNPDIVVITGDLVDTNLKYAKSSLDILTKLQSRYGTYFIDGNHEYFHGVKPINDYIKSLGITVLENSNIYIGEKGLGFNLAGVYDVMGERFGAYKPDINKALNDIDSSSPTILLAHQPRFIYEVKDNVDLVLSGHTHGGQIFPFAYLVRLQQPYVKGLHQHNSSTQIYVNKGTGFWGPPMRLFAKPEISELILERND